ncbi:nuclear transport factor 2 family protein [Ensifer sp. ENS05]|uniref:nuclear transport factor 2 family protein n=1 Tax=Ensifer sp. ENS05 TaxID=2769277 RepID=UPI0017809557|nr:nuclear transport factor 2 family protein [Ensifer sp. ENS05]MBD9597326.1 nuclear transport factor 2 family protein [Ensifer sp. ENS05]
MTMTAQQVLDAENARIKALVDKDIDRLDEILSPKLTYIHSNGHVDNKSEVIDKMRGSFRYAGLTRGTLHVEIYGETAVMTGPMDVHFISANDPAEKVQAMSAMVTQVWIQEENRPRMVAYQVAKTA